MAGGSRHQAASFLRSKAQRSINKTCRQESRRAGPRLPPRVGGRPTHMANRGVCGASEPTRSAEHQGSVHPTALQPSPYSLQMAKHSGRTTQGKTDFKSVDERDPQSRPKRGFLGEQRGFIFPKRGGGCERNFSSSMSKLMRQSQKINGTVCSFKDGLSVLFTSSSQTNQLHL